MSHLEGLLIALSITGAYFVCERLHMFVGVIYRWARKERATDETSMLKHTCIRDDSIDNVAIVPHRDKNFLIRYSTRNKYAIQEIVDWRDFNCDHDTVTLIADDCPIKTYKECGCAVEMSCETCDYDVDKGDDE